MGVSGTGKSSLSNELRRLGYETYDLDAMSDISMMLDKETRLPATYDHHNDLEKVQKMEWVYVRERMEDLIAKQKDEIAFYCGIPFNLNEILPLFNTIILLTANAETIRQRLNTRTSNDFGKTVEVQEWILKGKDKLEQEVREKGAIVIPTDRGMSDIATAVIGAINSPR